MNIGIVTVAYNRCDSLQRLLMSLEKAYYNQPVTLIISVDKSKTDIVERFADEYSWPHGEKIVDKHKINLGLRPHMMSLGKWFDRFDAIVVLEDDIVVSHSFYAYSCQAVEKYKNCADIAGISLYGFSVNYQKRMPFVPLKDEHDAYFMNCAMSWGEVWMRDSWKRFYEWYLNHQDFPSLIHLPKSICSWNQKSWLKYHTRYCIEENKYFLHPFVSLATNYGDAGEHASGVSNTVYQVQMQDGEKTHFYLPKFGENAVYYDGFFENKYLYKVFGLSDKELCVDLQGGKHNKLKCRYWLTTEKANYKIIQSYGLNFRPIEKNVIVNNQGEGIFLYDTTVVVKNTINSDRKAMLYRYYLSNLYFFVKQYGFANAVRDFFEALKIKFN